ncbi:MAG: hypothetical protein ACT4P7_10535 [Gemmatimonadaceae bacterium]
MRNGSITARFPRTRAGSLTMVATVLCAVSVGARAQGVDSAGTGAAFATFEAACRGTATSLWGARLCGPLALVHRQTRLAISNRTLPAAGLEPRGTVWVGRLPDSVLIANTSFRWHGVDYAMVVLPLPADAFDRTALLAHESFHRIQRSLGLAALELPNTHLDERDGRMWLRLELQALAHALTTRGSAQRQHARTALAFRAERHRLFPSFAAAEDSLEIHEGLVEYTGQAVAAWKSNLGPLRHVRAIDAVTRRPSFVRSFAYATVPALGLLLDQLSPGWHQQMSRQRSLARMLASVVGTGVDVGRGSTLVAMAQPYGYQAVYDAETSRERARLERVAAFMRALVVGPVLRLEQDQLMRSFDPNALVAMDTLGIAYPTGEFVGPWGRLTVDAASDGALLSSDMRLLRVSAPPDYDGRTLKGKGWVLELAEGWTVRTGARDGDVVATRVPND